MDQGTTQVFGGTRTEGEGRNHKGGDQLEEEDDGEASSDSEDESSPEA